MSSISLSLEDRLKRFEERMGEDEEKTRPKRRPLEAIVDEAIEVITDQIATESVKLGGHFRMEAQKQAQKERVRDLEWLVKDLQKVREYVEPGELGGPELG